MDASALLTRFRRDMKDEANPPLFPDDEVYSFMNEAQKMFCRLTGGIVDSRSAITQITATATDEYVELSPLILKIKGARHTDTGINISILNYEDIEFGTKAPCNDYGFTPGLRLTQDQGTVKALVTGMTDYAARLIDIPEVDTDISLSVLRLPLVDIDSSHLDFEIQDTHVPYLLYYVKGQALLKQDAETFDKNKSNEMMALFTDYCTQARLEIARREHKPRTVSYGGI